MNTKLSQKQWITFGLAVATGVIHLILGLTAAGTDIIFILNGLGFLGLIAALYILPQTKSLRPQIRWALLGYTALTFILYFVINPDAFTSPLGLLTKAIELGLMVMLWLDR